MDLSPITYMSPEHLLLGLDGSVDMGNSEYCFLCGHNNCEDSEAGDHIQARIESLLNAKFKECDPVFEKSILRDGIQRPVCIEVDSEGKWWQGNGHHRLAVALNNYVPFIPVVFAFDGDYMHEHTTDSDQYPWTND
jgi:hypothetical protein